MSAAHLYDVTIGVSITEDAYLVCTRKGCYWQHDIGANDTLGDLVDSATEHVTSTHPDAPS